MRHQTLFLALPYFIFFLMAATTSVATERDPCGGYLDVPVTGYYYGWAVNWVVNDKKDLAIACKVGSNLDANVKSGEISRRIADTRWRKVFLRQALCDDDVVNEVAQADIEKVPGSQLALANRYCQQTWSYRDNHIAFPVLEERTDWLLRESFCEFVIHIDKPFFKPELCKLVRDGKIDVDDAFHRWARETGLVGPGGPGPSFSQFLKHIGTKVSGIISWLVGAIVGLAAFIGVIIGIAVGVKRLSE